MTHGIFITATDTGVGKTFISALLGRNLKKQGCKVCVFKPIATGCINKDEILVSEDALFLKSFIGLDMSLEQISPCRFIQPLSPLAAQMESGKTINMSDIFDAFFELQKKYDFVIVEGIGGVKVPILKKYYVSDMIKDMKLPALIVSRPYLGTINHTLLTIDELKNKGIEIAGIVLNHQDKKEGKEDLSLTTNASIIIEESDVKVIKNVPYFSTLDKAKDFIFSVIG